MIKISYSKCTLSLPICQYIVDSLLESKMCCLYFKAKYFQFHHSFILYRAFCSVWQKKFPKIFCHFLSNRSEFLHEISHLLLILNHIKLLSSIVLFFMTKLLNFLGNHIVISDVRRMFAERKTHHICNVT